MKHANFVLVHLAQALLDLVLYMRALCAIVGFILRLLDELASLVVHLLQHYAQANMWHGCLLHRTKNGVDLSDGISRDCVPGCSTIGCLLGTCLQGLTFIILIIDGYQVYEWQVLGVNPIVESHWYVFLVLYHANFLVIIFIIKERGILFTLGLRFINCWCSCFHNLWFRRSLSLPYLLKTANFCEFTNFLDPASC